VVSKLILAIKLSFFDDVLPVMGELRAVIRTTRMRRIPCPAAGPASGSAATALG